MAAQHDTDDITEATLRVGRTLRDKWHLDALIDVGGMAAVYAATHRNGMRGAVKILHRHRSVDPDIAARFRREGYIANKVDHPNAVSVLDDDVDDEGSAFLVMELLEGSTLRDRSDAHGGTLDADEVLLAVDQLLDVLAVAHDVAIIHRDVKPENVFITAVGQVKILDFGIARLSEPGAPGHSETMAGLPMGSPAFMSPEQARGRWDLVHAQSDVWSVGATMFTLLSGQDVHTEQTVPELLAAIFSKPARSLAAVVPDAHPALVEVVDRALQLRISDRWPDARAMQEAVREAYLAIYGVSLPAPVRTLPRGPTSNVSRHELGHESHVPTPGATTVTAEEAVARRFPRRLALASAFVLAGALALAGRERATSSQDWASAHASSSLAELGEAPSSPSTLPTPPSESHSGAGRTSRADVPSPRGELGGPGGPGAPSVGVRSPPLTLFRLPVASRLTLVIAVAIPLVCRSARADTPDPADTLFRQGRASADAGDYVHACVAFAESLRLDPAPGTLLNLADCEEHVGRFASAWGHFQRLQTILPATDERWDIARQRALALGPRVPWMTITLAPGAPRDARVFRDDVEMDASRLAVPLPVDPGPHSVLVVAPWYESRAMTVVAVEREALPVVASPGPPVPRDVGPPAPAPGVASAPGHRAAWLAGTVGVVSLGVGTYFGSRALAERHWSDASCTAGVCANGASLAEYEAARGDARAADVALGVGVVALAVGGYLILSSRAHARTVAVLRVSGAGMGAAW